MLSLIKTLFKGRGSAGAPSKAKASSRRRVEITTLGAVFEAGPGETLLEAALSQGIAYPHSCTVGTCGSCKTRLAQGRVQACSDFGYALSRQELEAGYILACQAVPRDPLTMLELPAAPTGLRQAETFDATIERTEPLTHDILKVWVKADRPVAFTAGQYASLEAPGLPRGRNYSFADAPQQAGSDTLSFFIRKVPGGAFTGALFDDALTGLPLKMQAPHGTFFLREGDAPMVCIAGGSGLAPLISVLQDMRGRGVQRPCVLLFGARTQGDLYALEQIRSIADAWPAAFAFIPILSQEPQGSGWSGARGMVTDFIGHAAPGFDWHRAEGYLCGPPPMIDAAIERLAAMGIGPERIFYDKFTDGVALAPELEAA